MVPQLLVGQDLLYEVPLSHSDTQHSVALLWTSDQHDAETSTWQHTKHTRDIHVPDGIWISNPTKRAAVNPRLRSHSHWDRQICLCLQTSNSSKFTIFLQGFAAVHLVIFVKDKAPSHYTFCVHCLSQRNCLMFKDRMTKIYHFF
jgi:hypothetical protein